MSDLQANLIELTNTLGLNLTSNDTRIKHSKTGELNISSNGTINIDPTVKLGVTTNKVDILSDTINITAKNFTINIKELTESESESENNSININGGFISIHGGDGLEGINGYGGDVEIIGGLPTGNGSGGNVRLVAGGSDGNGNGGDVNIEAGLSKYYPTGYTGGNIKLQSGLGGFACGDINLFVGPTYIGGSPLGGNAVGHSGRVAIHHGAFKLATFSDETVRTNRIPHPEKGDMCFVHTSGAGDNLIHYWNGTHWKALQTID
jgi:hypothetical protein